MYTALFPRRTTLRALLVATAFDLSRIASLEPQAHDVRMDFVVTETGIAQCLPDGMQALSATQLRSAVHNLLAERTLLHLRKVCINPSSRGAKRRGDP